MQRLFEMDEFRHLAFHQFCHRDTGPLGDHFSDVFCIDFFFQHSGCHLKFVEVCGCFVDATFEFGNSAVANFGGKVEICFSFGLAPQLLKFFFKVANRLDGLLLGFPALFHG